MPIKWNPAFFIGLTVARDWGQEEKGTTEDEMAGWHHWLDAHEFEWTLGGSDGQGGLVCCISWGHKESDTTERLNWTELNWIINDIEHLLTCLFDICIIFSIEVSFQILALFKNWAIFLLLSLKNTFTYLVCKFFFRYFICHQSTVSITSLNRVFQRAEVLNLMKPNLSMFKFYLLCFDVISKNYLSYTRSERLSPKFTSRYITALGFTFRSMVYFELIIMHSKKYRSKLIFKYMDI